MEIKVFSEREIQDFKTDKKHIVISVQDPKYDFVKLPDQDSRIGWIGLNFFDLDQKLGDYIIFSQADAKSILTFVEAYKDKVDLICVNCVAGISRSAGIAGALSKIYNKDDSYFFKHYLPNNLVYSTILGEFYE